MEGEERMVDGGSVRGGEKNAGWEENCGIGGH